MDIQDTNGDASKAPPPLPAVANQRLQHQPLLICVETLALAKQWQHTVNLLTCNTSLASIITSVSNASNLPCGESNSGSATSQLGSCTQFCAILIPNNTNGVELQSDLEGKKAS